MYGVCRTPHALAAAFAARGLFPIVAKRIIKLRAGAIAARLRQLPVKSWLRGASGHVYFESG